MHKGHYVSHFSPVSTCYCKTPVFSHFSRQKKQLDRWLAHKFSISINGAMYFSTDVALVSATLEKAISGRLVKKTLLVMPCRLHDSLRKPVTSTASANTTFTKRPIVPSSALSSSSPSSTIHQTSCFSGMFVPLIMMVAVMVEWRFVAVLLWCHAFSLWSWVNTQVVVATVVPSPFWLINHVASKHSSSRQALLHRRQCRVGHDFYQNGWGNGKTNRLAAALTLSTFLVIYITIMITRDE